MKFLKLKLILLAAIMLPVIFSCKNRDKSAAEDTISELSGNPYNLEIIDTIDDYLKCVSQNENNTLVDLEDYIPNVAIDIKYATPDNFTGQIVYSQPKAYVRKPVADSLQKIQTILNEKGLGLKILDAYRPYSATLLFYEIYGDTTFVAAPWKGSIHNRGVAVDLTIIDLATKEELIMPTPFDDFSPKASHTYTNLDPIQIKNREKLFNIMLSNGFTHYEHEWWHYNFKDRDYQLMDLSFDDLEKIKEILKSTK